MADGSSAWQSSLTIGDSCALQEPVAKPVTVKLHLALGWPEWLDLAIQVR